MNQCISIHNGLNIFASDRYASTKQYALPGVFYAQHQLWYAESQNALSLFLC